jgi:hypothetical protein
MYADPVVGREKNALLDMMSKFSYKYGEQQYWPMTMIPFVGAYWDGKMSWLIQTTADLMRGEDFMGAPIDNAFMHTLKSFLPMQVQESEGQTIERSLGLMGVSIKPSRFEDDLSYGVQNDINQRIGKQSRQQKLLQAKIKNADFQTLQAMLMRGEISSEQFINNMRKFPFTQRMLNNKSLIKKSYMNA